MEEKQMLMVEQLKAMAYGDWCWVQLKSGLGIYHQKSCKSNENFFDGGSWAYPYQTYGVDWFAYKNKEQAEYGEQ